jgi:hypothetical protein
VRQETRAKKPVWHDAHYDRVRQEIWAAIVKVGPCNDPVATNIVNAIMDGQIPYVSVSY